MNRFLIFASSAAAFQQPAMLIRSSNVGRTAAIRLYSSTASTNGSTAASTKTSSARLMTESFHKLFNQQIRNELRASQLYLAASIWFDRHDLEGMSRYTRGESIEERGHALGMIDYGQKRNFPLELLEIPSPNMDDWSNPLQLWEFLLDAERENTAALLKLADEAKQCNDHTTEAFLQPYHLEQVDSEDRMETYVAKVKEESKTPGLLRQLDGQLDSEAEEDPTPML